MLKRLFLGLLALAIAPLAIMSPAAAQYGGGYYPGPVTSAQIVAALGYTPLNPAAIGSDLLFSPDATYDIGKSGATRPRNFFASGTGTFGGAISSAGATITSSFTATGLVTNASLATAATNTVKGNATSGSASPTDLAVGTCSTAASALIWTTNTGFGCNTSITAAAVPASGLTGATLAAGVTGSSLTSVGTLTTLTMGGTLTGVDASAWSTTGFALGVNGSVGTPALRRGTTGMYFSAANGSLSLGTNGVNAVTFDTSQLATFASGIVTGGTVNAGTTSALAINGRSYITSPADGDFTLNNNAGTSFGKLQIGGTTASFPAIKRNATALNFRLADDSGDAPITAAAVAASGNLTMTAGAFQYVAAGGTADAQTLTYSPAVTAYATGAMYCFRAVGSNTTTTPTWNVNGLGAKTGVKRASTALAANDVLINGHYCGIYNGTNIQILNPAVP